MADNLTAAQRVALARHPERPGTAEFIQHLFTDFFEQRGDRMCAEAAKIAKGEAANLKIGYLRTYAGGEFHRALAAFSARYPDVSVSIAYGSHGELCDMLSEDRVEITLNDQRRLFPTPTKI